MSARVLKWAVFSVGVGFIALFLALAVMRLAYPYEVEWMEGSMLMHSVRILESKPIYTAPSIDFVAWLYPPLYYYAVAAAMKLFGIGFFAGRFVSFLSTILTSSLLGWTVGAITRRKDLALITSALFLATYHLTGFYFDIARNDAFFTFLIVASAFSVLKIDGMRGAALSAVLISAAFLTKQQAIFFFPALALWYWVRSKKHAIAFTSIAIATTATVLLLWNAATNGWMFYYLFTIPSAKRADFSMLRAIEALPHFALGPLAFSMIAVGVIIYDAGFRSTLRSGAGLVVIMCLAALIAGAVSLGNDGGDANVMMPFAAFATMMIPIAISKITDRRAITAGWIAVLCQFAALYFNPLSEKMLIASAHQRAGGNAFMQKLRSMDGEVYIPYHSFISWQAGKPTQANILATLDALRPHDTCAARLQADIDSAFARHRFSAIIMEENSMIPVDSVSHYSLCGRMLAEPNVFLTRFGPTGTRPQFIYLPK